MLPNHSFFCPDLSLYYSGRDAFQRYNMHEIHIQIVEKQSDLTIGRYKSCIKPAKGEYLDANNGHWLILDIQHDIAGTFEITAQPGLQVSLIAYVVKVSK